MKQVILYKQELTILGKADLYCFNRPKQTQMILVSNFEIILKVNKISVKDNHKLLLKANEGNK